MARFWPNFKGRFLGPSLTDAICHWDICPGNICTGDICPYKEYLRCCWPDFDQTLKVGSWNHLSQMPTVTVTFVHATFFLATFVHIGNISAVTDPIFAKLNLNSIQFNSIQINWGWDSPNSNFSYRHIGSATNSDRWALQPTPPTRHIGSATNSTHPEK